MEDDKLRELFQDFRPPLSSDIQFCSRLKRRMESVELVKRHAEAVRRRNRIAVMVAVAVGFVMGVGLTLLCPLIDDAISSSGLSVPGYGISAISIDWRMASWIVMGIVSVLTAINAYEITVSRLSAKDLRVS